jgi:hypothetical protein
MNLLSELTATSQRQIRKSAAGAIVCSAAGGSDLALILAALPKIGPAKSRPIKKTYQSDVLC